jgi:hypothetical protein
LEIYSVDEIHYWLDVHYPVLDSSSLAQLINQAAALETDSAAARCAVVLVAANNARVKSGEAGSASIDACNAISSWAQYADDRSSYAKQTIEFLLSGKADCGAEAKVQLLEGLKLLTQLAPGQKGFVTPSEAGRLCLVALEGELTRGSNSPESTFPIALLAALEYFCYSEASPIIDAVAAYHPVYAVRTQAAKTLGRLRNAVSSMWEITVPDTASPESTRAARLSKTLEEGDEPSIVQAVCSNCKGKPITSVEDPRLEILLELVASDSEFLQLAAGWALIESYESLAREISAAVYALANISFNSETPILLRDALSALERLEKDFPQSAGLVTSAKMAANLKFVKKHTKERFDKL